MQREIKLSTLRCKPYFADNSDCSTEHYGLDYPFECVLWRVSIDDEYVAKTALPFLSTDNLIQLGTNKCIPVFGDGGSFVSVRSYRDKVLWFGFQRHIDSIVDGSLLPVNEIYVFSQIHYNQVIEQANTVTGRPKQSMDGSYNLLNKLSNYLFGNSVAKSKVEKLPMLTVKETNSVLTILFPNDMDLPLYRMPELADDARGVRLFRAVWEAISLQAIQVSEPPPNPIEVRIGLDKDMFVESIWQVGKIGDDVAVLFISEPYFPLWLCGFRSILPLVQDALNSAE